MHPASRDPLHRRNAASDKSSDTCWPSWARLWTSSCLIVSGALALAWLLLRTGVKPSRFAYPCQRAALSTAGLAFGAPLIAAAISARRRLRNGLGAPGGLAIAGSGLLVTIGIWGYSSRASDYPGPNLAPGGGYRADVFNVVGCAEDPIGDRFGGFDQLLTLMGRGGLKFYQSNDESLVAGPAGIIAADDTVVIKINYQWGDRGGTNTDLLRGLIGRIVDHPDTFTGEVVVCENAQFNSINGFNRSNNNAQDHGLSPHDVVLGFQMAGHNVSHFDWTVRRGISVTEYDTGNMTDGYIVYAYDSQLQGSVSYPKFQTDYGTYISLKYGIWDPISSSYDRSQFKFINAPVLKSHNATYGATACVKHYMGVVTGSLSTNSHTAIGYGILGGLLAEIQPADLNILDAIWVNADPYDGPWTTYAAATRLNQLVASTDPVAADIWAVKNILIPAFLAEGYSPPWPYPSADPDNPNSSFRRYLDNSMNEILAGGYDVTNNLSQIDAVTWGGGGDFDRDGDIDLSDYADFSSCFSGPGGGIAPGCNAGDLDNDGDVDCDDWVHFLFLWTGPGSAPDLAACQPDPPAEAIAEGCRYVRVVPPDTVAPVALLVSGSPIDPAVACVSRYVQLDGTLGADPVFQTSAEWGTVHVYGTEIIPEASYNIQVDYGSPGSPNLSSPVGTTMWNWGDVDHDGNAGFLDMLYVVYGFQDNFTFAALEAVDIHPCLPDGTPGFLDVLDLVWAFKDRPYTDTGCSLPCE